MSTGRETRRPSAPPPTTSAGGTSSPSSGTEGSITSPRSPRRAPPGSPPPVRTRASTLALWESRPGAPVVAAVRRGPSSTSSNVPAIFGRRMLDRLWSEGPGSGPVARSTAAGCCCSPPPAPPSGCRSLWLGGVGRTCRTAAPCHGTGDAVTVPPLAAADPPPTAGSRAGWSLPDTRHPWLPGPEVLLWALRPGGPRDLRREGPYIDFSSRRSGC